MRSVTQSSIFIALLICRILSVKETEELSVFSFLS